MYTRIDRVENGKIIATYSFDERDLELFEHDSGVKNAMIHFAQHSARRLVDGMQIELEESKVLEDEVIEIA